MTGPPITGTGAEDRPAVSVIVPVYNTAPYLRRCVDSLIRQTLRSIEILLIDDGSTDGSGDICDEYAAGDGRIRAVHQKNGGLSRARNAGLDLARADYLMFADSDDWVEPDFCRIPFGIAAETGAELVMFRHRHIRSGCEIGKPLQIPDGVVSQAEAVRQILGGCGMVAWNKLYHRRLFLETRYPEDRIYEDTLTTPLLVRRARRIVCAPAVLYNHEDRAGSITTNRSETCARDRLFAVESTVGRLRAWGFEAEAERYYQTSALAFLSAGWQCRELNDKCRRYLLSLRRCPAHFTPKQRCRFYLCVLSPGLYRLARWLYRRFRP